MCLHAVGHDGADFAPLTHACGDRFEFIAPDWPGHGASPGDGAGPDARAYAEIALSLCAALGLDRPILIGNSIGGAAALISAHAHPGRFSGLVLCNPGGLAPIDAAARFVIGRMAAFYDVGARGAPWFKPAFAAYYRYAVLSAPEAAKRRAEIVAHAGPRAALLAQAWRGFGQPQADLRALVPELRLPVWYAWARGDRFVAWSRARKAARRAPDHAVTLFQGSHAPFLEAPERFAKGFRAFAARLPAALDARSVVPA
ncbi:MAG: alpha/beta hydrolase [Hyphomonadaceae bacterium]|nr:alpha/beta hydrolase [Hyphomonadaceae bacterium]